jgi:superfamily I DNA/RNA helicase
MGKTTTITAKIAYMVEKENIDPSHILALTFSKEADRNMREKVEKLLQGKEILSGAGINILRVINVRRYPSPVPFHSS